MKKIYINIHPKNWRIHNYYRDAFWWISKKYDLDIFLFSQEFKEENILEKDSLEKNRTFLFTYDSEENLFEIISKMSKEFEIVYLDTFTEKLIPLANSLKKHLWQRVTENYELFRNKKLQRELMLSYNPKITVNYLEKDILDIDFDEIKNQFWLPFILKPKDWQESSWVAKIKNEEEFDSYVKENSFRKQILVEEFIDWELYSVDYFVDENWTITENKPVKVPLAIDIWIDDFFNLSRIISLDIEKEIDLNKLRSFVNDNVKSTKIRNTFVHHEFKLTSRWELKTIELNWRVGWYRLEMYNLAYWYNLLDAIFWDSNTSLILNNIAIFALYPVKRWILKEINQELLDNIKKLKSFHSANIMEDKYVWKEVWLTKEWFWKVWWIRLVNSDIEQFRKDYSFLENNYKDLLILE